MNTKDVHRLLEDNKSERGIANWKRMDPSNGKWTSYGLGMTRLKKLGKKIGRDHKLALELWKEKNYDCRILATLIDEPGQVTEEQVEQQVDDIGSWMIVHSFCSNLMPKVSFLREKAEEWMACTDTSRRHCGYLLLEQLAKRDKNLPDSYFRPHIDDIEKSMQSEENFVRDAMNNALWAIGMRSPGLHQPALSAAKRIGKVEVDYGDNSCQAIDVVKHLASDRVKSKLGIK